MIHLARRLCGDSQFSRTLASANGGVRQLKVGVKYRVPFSILLPENQRRGPLAVVAVFMWGVWVCIL